MQETPVMYNPYKNRVMSPLPSSRPISLGLSSKLGPVSSRRGLNISVDLNDPTPKATRRERSVLNVSTNCDSDRSVLAGKFSITQFLDSMVTQRKPTTMLATPKQPASSQRSLATESGNVGWTGAKMAPTASPRINISIDDINTEVTNAFSKGVLSVQNRRGIKTEHDRKLERSVSRGRKSTNSLELKDHVKPSYYMKALQYYNSLSMTHTDLARKYKEHLLQSLASVRFLKKVRVPSIDNVQKSRMQLAQLDNQASKSRFCLIFRGQDDRI